MKKLKWHTEQRIINDLIPYEQNPRTMTDKTFRDIMIKRERLKLWKI